jgi:arginine N-succinyltransferase
MSPPYLVRAVRESDLAGLRALRDLAGPGFTSLAIDDATLRKRLEASCAVWRAPIAAPGPDQRYFLALEHCASGALAGVAAVKACVGEDPPFFNFRVLKIAQASHAAGRRFDMEVLILVNEFTGCSEVGSLFVHPDHRAGGVGRLLAQSRYLLMAADPRRFAPTVVSELRGVVDADGRSPFWEHLGRHFFRMDFAEADRLSATTDNQFILDLMPKYPIYVDLLPPPAREIIGRCHPMGEGALKLLKWEGFRFDNVVDIFDGGPLVTAPRDSIRTFRESRRSPLRVADGVPAARGLVANSEVAQFACASSALEHADGLVRVPADTLAALGMREGEEALAWAGDAH